MSALRCSTRIFSRPILLLLVSLLVRNPIGTAAEPDPDPAKTEAKRALGKRDLVAAEALITQALKASPTNADWLLLRADLTASQGHERDALTQVQEIVRQHPEHRRGRIREAQLLSNLGKPFSAAERYQAYLRESPSDIEARIGLGQTFYARGNWRTAENLFAEVLKEEPDHELAIYAYLRVLIASGRVSIAWRVASEHDRLTEGKDGELGLILAGMAGRVGASEQAVSLASRSTDDPDLLRRQLAFRAMLLIRNGDHQEGLKLIEPYARPDSTDYDGLMDAANAYQAADQRVTARALFERALALSPERTEARLGLARLASREGRLAGSLAYYQKVAEENPEQIEAWLGVIRIAHLLNDPEVVAAALEKAWKIAPGSALLFQEDIRLALQAGDAEVLAASLRQYTTEQPEDRTALLWLQRWRHVSRNPVQSDVLLGLLDPLSPESTAIALNLLFPRGESPNATIALVPQAPEKALQAPSARALAIEFANLLNRDASRAAAQAAPESIDWSSALANAWWAYLSTPLSLLDELSRELDSQAASVWLAAEIQRRLRVFQSETESPLWDEWLLRRAFWLATWRDQWATPAASEDLRKSIDQLVPDWAEGVRGFQIDEAWRESERPLPASLETFPQLISRVRWRQHRYDYDGALALLRSLENAYPLSVEAIQRQAEILRASGRRLETEKILRRLAAGERPSPIIRLDYAELLRKQGRSGEARYQLDLLREDGFAEPEYYLQEALLAESQGLDHAAWDWSVQGLQNYPQAPGLLAFQADWLNRHDQSPRLAELLSSGGIPSWAEPDIVAEAAPYLSPERLGEILSSPQWIFNWQWLSWNRLETHSLAVLEKKSNVASASGELDEALESVQPALTANLPESDLWLRAGRLLYLDHRTSESQRAYRLSALLGGGRPDAEVAELAQLARRKPKETARELLQRLEDQPDDRSLRSALVLALLRAGKVGEANRVLEPLLESDPGDPDVRMLAAQVRGAMGRVQQARSLYSSLIENDPLGSDIVAGKMALRDSHEWGVTVGYEYDLRNSTSGSGASLPAWQQAFVSAFLRRPFAQTVSIEYDWYDRVTAQASQLLAVWTRGLGPDWIVQANAGIGLSGDIVPQWRAGAGASYRLFGECFANLDFNYQDFTQVNVLQIVPGIIWQWNPRGRLAARAFVTQYWSPTGATDQGVFWSVDESWQFGSESWLIVNFGAGGKGVTNDQIILYGDDTQDGVSISWRQGWMHRWLIQPSYRFEVHKTFNLHALSLSAGVRF
ncbi:MAG TPA: tetratricopeptide repeat protein [Candidatus Nitrosotalea sp.]|nr:tetratricopeptide repeat protein [Candidatus Nitrosotalea sp.]